MLCVQLVGLVGDVVPLPAADAIHERCDVEPVLEETPVFFLGAAVARVGDGIAEVSHSLALPGMGKHGLWNGGNRQCHEGDDDEKASCHISRMLIIVRQK